MKNTFLYSIIIIIAVVNNPILPADSTGKRIFGGGMAVQGGYTSLENPYGEFSGAMFGLGGRLHFYLGTFIRLGGGGAAVKLSYEEPGLEGSYVRIGYGGITIELTRQFNNWQLSGGLLFGGAGFNNLHIISKTNDSTVNSFLDDRSTLLLSPIVTLERSLSSSISLMAMVDYLWGPDLGEKHHLGGPKVHVGVLFNK